MAIANMRSEFHDAVAAALDGGDELNFSNLAFGNGLKALPSSSGLSGKVSANTKASAKTKALVKPADNPGAPVTAIDKACKACKCSVTAACKVRAMTLKDFNQLDQKVVKARSAVWALFENQEPNLEAGLVGSGLWGICFAMGHGPWAT